MPRIALWLEYDGRRFSGSQFQPGRRTVQGELEKALAVLARQPVTAVFSGRTDTGVHARMQVVHCDWPVEVLDTWRLSWQLNGILPRDVSVRQVAPASSQFHARLSALSRSYAYRILNRPQRSALFRHSHYFVSLPLDVEAMSRAAAALVGEHDFSSFKSSNSDRVSTICRISRAELLNLGEGVLEFWVTSNHFVYNMVRIIVGTLTEIGLGKKTPESLVAALVGKSRDLAGPTAPPWGLCLESIEYPDKLDPFGRVNREQEQEGWRVRRENL